MAKQRKDIILDENFNMQANGRDILIADSDAQHVSFILMSPKGAFREFPYLGVSLESWTKKPFSSVISMKREITVQLKNDGYGLADFDVSENGEIMLNYEKDYE